MEVKLKPEDIYDDNVRYETFSERWLRRSVDIAGHWVFTAAMIAFGQYVVSSPLTWELALKLAGLMYIIAFMFWLYGDRR